MRPLLFLSIILSIFLSMTACTSMDYRGRVIVNNEQAEALGYRRIVTEFKRSNPDYKYVVEIKSSSVPILGGWDVYIEGFKLGTDQVDDNQVEVHEWFFSKPDYADLAKLVDNTHNQIRGSQSETDWDKDAETKRKEILDQLRKELDEKYRNQLERELKDLDEKLKDRYEKNKPKF